MHHYFFHRMQVFALISFLMGLWGCATLMETMPTPPSFLARIELNGPYDADIPTPEANQIKRASLALDWAVPYIFLSVATHFEAKGDRERSIHFFNRAIAEFHKRSNAHGEGTAFSRKIAALLRFGNMPEAVAALAEMEKKWLDAPLKSFVLYNYGYYYLIDGDLAKAQNYFREALATNFNDPADPDLLLLRRDAEWGYAMALIPADYFAAASGRLGLSDFDEDFYLTIRRNVSERLAHLEGIAALNERISHTRVIRYFPEMTPVFMECDVHNALGLSYGILGRSSEAVKHLETALALARKIDYPLGEADGIFFLNQVHLLGKNRQEGKKAAHDLETIAHHHRLVAYAIWAKMILAHHDQALGQQNSAMNFMREGLTLMEKNISWLASDTGFRSIGFFQRPDLYQALFAWHAGKGEARRAFETAEQAKASLVADRLGREITGEMPVGSDILKPLHFYRNQIARNYKRLLSTTMERHAFTNDGEQLEKVQAEYEKALEGIRQRDEALYSLLFVAPPDTGGIQRLLDENTTLFAYYTGVQHLYIWAISRNGFHQERINMPRPDVDRLVGDFRFAMMSRDKAAIDVLSEKIYDTFLRPVIPFVYGDRVVFVPHGALYHLPFASMRYVKSYLVDGFTIFYLPHAGLLGKTFSTNAVPGDQEALKRVLPQADYFTKINASVLASLWKVENESKTAFLEIFNKNMEKSGDAADALRVAQNDMIQRGYGPYDWAAFILMGGR